MKYILFLLVVPLILIMSYGGCGDDCVNCIRGLPSNCTGFEELIDTDCLGDELALSCFGMSCDSDPPVGFGAVIIDCGPLDCESIECGDTVLTDLAFDADNAQITTTVIDNGDDLGSATCRFFQP